MNEMYVVIDTIVGMVAVVYAIEVIAVWCNKREWEAPGINRQSIRELARSANDTPDFKYKSNLIKCTVCCLWLLIRHGF
jgi:hypothetical protein